MNKKMPLTIDEHRQIGTQLHEIYTRTLHAYCALANRLGKSKSLPKHLLKGAEHLSAARSNLDDVVYRQDRTAFDSHVYYPGTNVPEESVSFATLVGCLEAWARTIRDILGRIYCAFSVNDRAVKRLEKAAAYLEWSSGTLRMAVGNGEL